MLCDRAVRLIKSSRALTSAHVASCPLSHCPAACCALAIPGGDGNRAQREAQVALRLLRELLKRDYAVGYLFLSWLLRTSWTLAPAVAVLLGLPNPTDKGERACVAPSMNVQAAGLQQAG